jgi:hypothetical protein
MRVCSVVNTSVRREHLHGPAAGASMSTRAWSAIDRWVSSGGVASNVEQKICTTMSISSQLVRRIDETPKGAGSNKGETMRVMVFAKASEDSKMDGPPTPEQLEAFAAMDRFTEKLVKAGVFVAAAGLKNGAAQALNRCFRSRPARHRVHPRHAARSMSVTTVVSPSGFRVK